MAADFSSGHDTVAIVLNKDKVEQCSAGKRNE